MQPSVTYFLMFESMLEFQLSLFFKQLLLYVALNLNIIRNIM